MIGISLGLGLGRAAGGPALTLDFLAMTPATIDSRITFTRGSTGTYFNSSGVLSSAAINTPRFDYDPVTLAPKGLLIEEARTNLVTYSDDLSNAAWTKSNVTAATNVTVSPDGTSNADRVAASAIGNSRGVFASVTTTAVAHTISVFAKASGLNWLCIYDPAGSGTGGAWFNLSTGVVGTITAGYTASIANFGNGWYRCSIVRTLAAGTSFPFFGGVDGDNTITVSSTTNGIFLYGAQLEAGAFATSYIPTVASTVTRSADVATMTGTNFSSWFNAAEGSFVSVWDVVAVDSTARHEVWTVSDAGNQRLAHRASDTGVSAPLGAVGTGAAVLTLTGSSYSANTTVKTALAYGTTQSLAQNGAVPATSATASSIAGTSLSLGYTAGAAYLCGHIRQIAYYNTRLPDAQLQSLTA